MLSFHTGLCLSSIADPALLPRTAGCERIVHSQEGYCLRSHIPILLLEAREVRCCQVYRRKPLTGAVVPAFAPSARMSGRAVEQLVYLSRTVSRNCCGPISFL